MRLSAPTKPVFLAAVILAVLAVIGTVVVIPMISVNVFWVAIVAFVILAAGCMLKGV